MQLLLEVKGQLLSSKDLLQQSATFLVLSAGKVVKALIFKQLIWEEMKWDHEWRGISGGKYHPGFDYLANHYVLPSSQNLSVLGGSGSCCLVWIYETEKWLNGILAVAEIWILTLS